VRIISKEVKIIFEPSGLITDPKNPSVSELELWGHDGGEFVYKTEEQPNEESQEPQKLG
jgi:hypothetical protein